MKHLLPTFALLISSLFSPVAASAAPLICNGPSGLVYALADSCAAANVGVFPGFTVGNCLVIQADFSLGGGACGGSGGPTLAGNNTWTGLNSFKNAAGTNFGSIGTDNSCVVNIAQGSNSNDNYTCLGGSTDTCNTGDPAQPTVEAADFEISNGGFTGGANINMCIDLHNNIAFSNIFTTTGWIANLTGQTATLGSSGGGGANPILIDNSTNSSGLSLGRAGAPSGACVSGSIYTRSDGTVGAALYLCYGATWHASAT